MEHHLEFGRFRLQRGRNRGARRGCRWNLYGHYKPAGGGECQYFSRVAAVSKRRKWALDRGKTGYWEDCATRSPTASSKRKKPNRISGEPVYNRA